MFDILGPFLMFALTLMCFDRCLASIRPSVFVDVFNSVSVLALIVG